MSRPTWARGLKCKGKDRENHLPDARLPGAPSFDLLNPIHFVVTTVAGSCA